MMKSCYMVSFLVIILIFFLIDTAATSMVTAANIITKPGCQRQCGNVTIPYPFGIGKGCSMGELYSVTCNTTDNLPYLTHLGEENIQILSITDTRLRLVNSLVAETCGDWEEGASWDFTGLPYVYSADTNMFMVTGCQAYALIQTQTMAGEHVRSCVTVCFREEDLHERSCAGIGCCQTRIPKGLQNYNLTVSGVDVFGANTSSGNCSFALLTEHSRFNYGGAIELQDPKFRKKAENAPFVMDWFIANQGCEEAQRNSATVACQHNTACVNVYQELGVKGYRCQCLPGFEGNPYLSPGCSDIDECEGQNNCSHFCVNTLGNYTCYCPSGHHGDGRQDGTGCFSKNLRPVFAVGLVSSLGSILLLLGALWLLSVVRRKKKKWKRAKNFKRNGGLLLEQRMSSEEGVIRKPRTFTADELKIATNNFNEDRVLGQGGQGVVYKGMLSDGSIVAIKKSKIENESQVDQFINEVVILSQINHRNIVKLLGCCLETEVPLLVYEFIPNGALAEHIHDPSEEFPITWEMRLQIAIDVAGALTYMHSASSNPIFHRDIKTSNILLDEKYRAKVSDFGTSRSIAVDQTHLTTRVHGTFGYFDPEYFLSSRFTEKSDVYSFGVVLVELLTGQKAIRPPESPGERSLVLWFLSSMENSELESILEARVSNEATEEIVYAIANLAKRCLKIDRNQRPTMREVALESEVISSSLHHLPFCFQNYSPKAVEQAQAKTTESTSDAPLPSTTSYMEEEWSLLSS